MEKAIGLVFTMTPPENNRDHELSAIAMLRDHPKRVDSLLQEAIDDPAPRIVVDEAYWQRLQSEVFGGCDQASKPA
ncbi:MAG: hypothetical protein SH850_12450 [Planctomycetaceae bacterium]|nr:hypothetical protein [Planctomycetaceae bacterium]